MELAKTQRQNVIGQDCRLVEPLSRLWSGITSSIFRKAVLLDRIAGEGKSFEAVINPVMTEGDLSHVCVHLRDITALVNIEREFIKRNRELIITNTLSGAFISSENLGSVYADILEKSLLIFDFSMGWVVTRQDDSFTIQALLGVSAGFKNKLENKSLDFLYEDALRSGEPIYILESADISPAGDIGMEGIVFLCLVPFKAAGEVVGFVALASRVDVKFDFDLASLLSLVGNNLSFIGEKMRLFQETKRLAITDALTGLYNARHFYAVLDGEISRSKRYSTPFSLALLDIDDFKALNDTYGHQAGDEVLRSVAEILKRTMRKSDIVARYGGEEFIAVLPNSDSEHALHLAQRVKEAVALSSYLGEEAVGVTVSGGIATFPYDASDAKSLLYAADMAMYEAKAAGKNRITCRSAQ